MSELTELTRPSGASAAKPSATGLSALQGTALYVGAVLGTGVIALPALAAQLAGPASLLAWCALVLLSVPLAATFAALAARHPDAGGVSTYARLAFGERTAVVVGWCFFFTVPTGAAPAALFAGQYVAAALGGGNATATITAGGLMGIVTATNAAGLRVTGRVQLALAGLLALLLLLAVGLALPHAHLSNFTPFAPHGWFSLAPAAALLVWSFAGWEAITHLAAEFRRPARDLPRATAAALAVVGVLYLAVAFAVVTVLGPRAADSAAPLGDLMARGLGGNARLLAAGAAVLLTLGTMNAYYAGVAKLGAALGRDGALPGWLARGSTAGEVPRRSLTFVSALTIPGLVATAAFHVQTRTLVSLTAGLIVSVYAVGVLAALRLLPRRSKGRATALVALAAVALILAATGVYLVWAVVVSAAALIYARFTRVGRNR
ncbi:MAG TPA: amino acid permease [Actinocrinis sp.]|nr:amino acid permease [Actinocrinis sp.]